MKPYYASPGEIDRFKAQRNEYRFRYQCPDCVHIRNSDHTCSLEYPNRVLLEAEGFLELEGQFVFCKYFEMA
ncbi:MAG: hypothetical protein ISR64_09705 [Deltaproteobacteria bacterium]|nr:hypothetical protein [Deltaproteobacteria bacterium]